VSREAEPTREGSAMRGEGKGRSEAQARDWDQIVARNDVNARSDVNTKDHLWKLWVSVLDHSSACPGMGIFYPCVNLQMRGSRENRE
jgi:hypothetical protein